MAAKIQQKVQELLTVVFNPKAVLKKWTNKNEVSSAVTQLVRILTGNSMNSSSLPNFGFEWARKLVTTGDMQALKHLYVKDNLWPLFKPMYAELYVTLYGNLHPDELSEPTHRFAGGRKTRTKGGFGCAAGVQCAPKRAGSLRPARSCTLAAL